MSREKTDRNNEMYELNTHPDPKKKMSTYALSFKYHISQPAVWKILKRSKNRMKKGGEDGEKS